MSVSMRAIDSGVDQRIQSSDGRQVGHAGESSTILPLRLRQPLHEFRAVVELRQDDRFAR